jgi:hypothetical protein
MFPYPGRSPRTAVAFREAVQTVFQPPAAFPEALADVVRRVDVPEGPLETGRVQHRGALSPFEDVRVQRVHEDDFAWIPKAPG